MDTPNKTTLDLHSQFAIRSFNDQVNQMSESQAKEFLIQLYEQKMVQETLYKQFIKSQWGFNALPLKP